MNGALILNESSVWLKQPSDNDLVNSDELAEDPPQVDEL